ncbi:uncharacterized protein LOC116166167 isoform X2 [Photinus pyralis]|uniref:uncharacterized protein LOC116166167 isoform X2 n=1 Tax=Photinus pyralis TaxID=7054 RepID=UPI0012671EE5|nr:uncharacterized protein LOC116166167 isoform X2 [Photinus pyralis]
MMTSLALTLDNVDGSENTEQISKLFPKCRPRSDINLNPIISLGRNDDNVDNTLSAAMNNEKDNERWDGSCSDSKENVSPIHSTDDDDDIIIETEYMGDAYKLRDSRIIEIAGGREIYSQSRSKAVRKSRSITASDENDRRKNNKSPIKQGVWELRGKKICSVRQPDCDQKSNAQENENMISPSGSMSHGEIVIFDDIGDEWQGEGRLEEEHVLQNSTDLFSADLLESDRVAKVIGSLPIAVYEGSPRRYGPRPVETGTHPQLPSAQSLLASPSVYPPRPGFPQRIVCTPSDIEQVSITDTTHFSKSKPLSPSTATPATTAAFDYLYEFSETRKVLEEFFKCPPPEEENPLQSEFHDLDYELRLQSTDSGNSYVGQRLAKGRPDQCDFAIRIDSPKKHSNHTHIMTLQDQDMEHENNFLDLSIGTGSSGDLETTDCDSNCGDLDSEVSLMLMENELPTVGILGTGGDVGIVSDSSRLCSSMPVLEDGLSSGHASDTDNNNPTVVLVKRQITDAERELNQSINKNMQGLSKPIENGLSPSRTIVDVVNVCTSYEDVLSQVDSLVEKTPPPPAPVPHRFAAGEKPDDVEAAIKDIRLTLQRTKTLPFTSCAEEEREINTVSPIWVPRQRGLSATSGDSDRKVQSGEEGGDEDEADTDLETDRLLGQQRTDDQGFYDDKGWRKPKSRTVMPSHSLSTPKHMLNLDEGTIPLVLSEPTSRPSSPAAESDKSQSPQSQKGSTSSIKPKKDKEAKKKGRNKEGVLERSVLIEGVLFRARYLGSTQLVCEGQPTKTTRMMQAEEAVSRIKEASNQMLESYSQHFGPGSPGSASFDETPLDPEPDNVCKSATPSLQGVHDTSTIPLAPGTTGTVFRLQFLGSVEVDEEGGRKRRKRLKKNMVEVAVTKIKALAPDGETQPSTEVDLFISTEKIMVLNTDLKEIMMDHALRTISYIADIGDLVVLMARRRFVPHEMEDPPKINRTPKMICHVFESEEAQFIAQSIGQAFQVAYMEFLKANGIEDHSFVKEMDYQEVLNSQEIFGDELQMFAKKEMQKEVVVPKAKGEILGVVIVESGWGSMLPTVVIANLAPAGAAARCGQLNIGDQIIAINGVSLVGLPLSTCQNYIKNSKNQTVVKLTVVPCAPVVEVKIKRPDTKYQLGFSVQNGVICSLLRGGIAERGGVRVGHRIIEINNQSVVAVPHEKIVNLLATSVGEILMKTMPTSMFRLLTGQENPVYI